MERKFIKIASLVLMLILMVAFAGCSKDEDNGDAIAGSEKEQKESSGETVQISSLNIGDRVMDESWDWEFRTGYVYVQREGDVTSPITWIIVAKDHYNSLGVTLLCENLIAYFPFDTSRFENGLLAGQNHWGESATGTAKHGLRPWLNSNGIHDGEGFYSAFSDNFKSIVLETEIPNKEYEKGTAYTTNDKVFIPSSTELGDTEHIDTYEIGSVYPFFEGAEGKLRTAMIKGDGWGERNYWLRSPNTQGYRPVGSVYESGFFTNDFADFDSIGVRPVVNVSSSAMVSAEPDENGVYILKFK